jgi:hypothetical protein
MFVAGLSLRRSLRPVSAASAGFRAKGLFAGPGAAAIAGPRLPDTIPPVAPVPLSGKAQQRGTDKCGHG